MTRETLEELLSSIALVATLAFLGFFLLHRFAVRGSKTRAALAT